MSTALLRALAAIPMVAIVVVAGAAGCSANRDPIKQHRCLVFEGLSRSVPAGGVPITIDVPSSWRRVDYGDGMCSFRPPDSSGKVNVGLEFCVELDTPCDAAVTAGRVRETGELRLLGQVQRRTILKRVDPQTQRVVTCTAYVQGSTITTALDAQLQRLVSVCATLAIAP